MPNPIRPLLSCALAAALALPIDAQARREDPKVSLL
jgi:hypothetical protein